MRHILIVLIFLATVHCQVDLPYAPESLRKLLLRQYMSVRKRLQDVLGPTGSSQKHLTKAIKQKKVLKAIDQSVPFPCNVAVGKSTSVPTSVHRIRPGDIDVIAAVGDSLTAGFGIAAKTPLELFRENRGMSATIGGQGTWREFLTLPNILKNYNPNLFGYSLGDSLSWEWPSQFNVAETGAMTRDMPYMVHHLIERIKNDARVDINNHWKLISLFIGANDHCSDMCYTDEMEYLKKRKQNLIKTLDLLRDNLPRTFVNLIVSPNVGTAFPEYNVGEKCWFTLRLECPCILGSKFANKQHYYKQLVVQSLLMEIEVASMTRYDREDFTVVAQPFLFNVSLPTREDGKHDSSYLSQDCFHLSQRGHARGSNALWNNLLEPVGKKTIGWDLEYKNIKCVTPENPYLFTKFNSHHVKMN